MKQLKKQNDHEKTPLGSFLPAAYCQDCRQVKVCKRLDSKKCCSCVIENKTEQWKDYQTYRQSLDFERERRKEHERELRELAKGETAEDRFRFNEWKIFYRQKGWGLFLVEWLWSERVLPVDSQCAKLWRENKEHLPENCGCLARKAKKNFLFFAGRLRETKKRLKGCKCVRSEKVRIGSDNYAWCEICEVSISAASKKRVAKNRNDPRFWGLEIGEKVLCGDCLARFRVKMPSKKKKEFNRYLKVGRFG